jgi:hypothetical protein
MTTCYAWECLDMARMGFNDKEDIKFIESIEGHV